MIVNGYKLEAYTAEMLQDHLLFQLIDDGVTSIENRSLQKLHIAIVDALSEISAKYPVYVNVTVTTADGIIRMSQLQSAVTDTNGRSPAFSVAYVRQGDRYIPFTSTASELRVGKSGTYTVAIAPELIDFELNENIEVPDKVGFVMLMHLIARNFCIYSGRMEEADMFDSRYNDYAEMLSLKRRAHIPARKFV